MFAAVRMGIPGVNSCLWFSVFRSWRGMLTWFASLWRVWGMVAEVAEKHVGEMPKKPKQEKTAAEC
jgi:hypothetical protein